jgi:hypothetical protein
MGSLGLNSIKSMQFFNGDHTYVKFLNLLHAITMIGYKVKILFQPSDFPFGSIQFDACQMNNCYKPKGYPFGL